MRYPLVINKYLLKPVIQIFLFVSLLFFVSCSDDTVTPPLVNNQIQIIDSNIIDWEFEMLYNQQIYDIYVKDSNNIYLAGNPNSLYYNGKEFTPIYTSSDMFPICINGLDENNVFIGGNDYSFPIANSKLKKWNGSTIEDITMPNNDSSGGIDYIYVENINDLWLTTRSNKLYHYNNLNITSYAIPLVNNLRETKIFKYTDGKLYMFGNYLITNGIGYFVLKYDNSQWQILIKENETSDCRFALCSNDILRTGAKDVYLFNGMSWGNIVEIPEYTTQIVCGSSKNNFLVFGNFIRYGPFPVYYNGEKLFKQTDFQVPYPIMSTENVFTYKDNKFYGFIAGDPYNNALIKGKFKNNNIEMTPPLK